MGRGGKNDPHDTAAAYGRRDSLDGSTEGNEIANPYASLRTDHGVRAHTGVLPHIADLHFVMSNDRTKNIVVPG